MPVNFRNVEVTTDRVRDWPYEAIVTVIERGGIRDWAQLTREIRREPWGPVARQVELFLSYSRPWGVGPLLERAVTAARKAAEASERAEVAAQVRDLLAASGMSAAEFASAIGTSTSRLSTYRTGRVTPSAALMVRMRRLVERQGE